ncbi:MAG: alanine racemase [Flavobacteriaceae bacterium]
MSASTRLEVSLEALAHNYHHLRSLIPHSTELMAVVKANAYGTDLLRLSKELDILGANSFCVAYVDEGVALRNAGISKPILVIHAQIDSLEKGVNAGLDFSLYSLDFIYHLAKVAHGRKKQTTVHLNLNTGLNRLGIKPNELEEACSTLLASPQLHLGWMMTHLAASEDHSLLDFTRSQLEQFSAGHKRAEQIMRTSIKRHALNSSGVHNYGHAAFEAIRTGISLHGFANDPLLDQRLKPISSLISSISAIREIEAGDSVSYNRLFVADRPMRIATIGLGHADGIHRSLGHSGFEVLINGQRARAVGMICMDLFMVDVTHIDCSLHDEVLIFGPHNSAEMISKQADTIAYELLTGIGQRVPRTFV